ncbi:hypothetical protein [Providencia sp. CIM-Carb-044]|uniref:hypothetical protein n=1 Tax=Providencia sp. CIM-Carb-044 TaxID=3096048 RepID=UPI0024AB54F1|nr:hypothetical protein [Providencia sp. CIM-Carb-044]MCK9788022.1 hypothetical protein [Providencia rettgeri]MDX7424282.1 hypothetical protein [Providencia sp. CIM-Carb-044]
MGQQLSILTKALMAACAILLFWLIWVMNDFDKLQVKFDKKSNELSASQLLNKVTQSAITLHYQVSLDNIKAKQLEDSEHVKVKAVIKTVLKDNECANTAVPDDVVSELRNYKRGIDSRSVSANTSATNR